MARTTVANQLAAIRKQRELLDKKEQALKSKSHDKVLVKIVALAKEAGLTATDISKWNIPAFQMPTVPRLSL